MTTTWVLDPTCGIKISTDDATLDDVMVVNADLPLEAVMRATDHDVVGRTAPIIVMELNARRAYSGTITGEFGPCDEDGHPTDLATAIMPEEWMERLEAVVDAQPDIITTVTTRSKIVTPVFLSNFRHDEFDLPTAADTSPFISAFSISIDVQEIA